ncbi:uncharacterized protein RAG0_12497 [Rhynchosporium agropyri]|uniref:Xylanolytic transcriptional activator regulatory domain-containing protein n=1 Tax=Rhynchosporium agropyri TaxID=914238 RepID=A0A1E1L8K2_9HELO|nr:uncharacterized protein RAG0_12497 [Rhynchosporium agropyri]
MTRSSVKGSTLEVIVIAHKWTLESLAFADWTGNGRAANNETAVFDASQSYRISVVLPLFFSKGFWLKVIAKSKRYASLPVNYWVNAAKQNRGANRKCGSTSVSHGPASVGFLSSTVTTTTTTTLTLRPNLKLARCHYDEKIRCNGRNPVCSSCKRSGLACMSSAKHNDRSSKAGLNVPLERNFHDRDRQSVTEGGNSRDITEPSALEVGIETAQPERITHEIGLVSVTAGQDLRYVGPSSGYSFAKLLFANISRRNATRGQNGLIWLRIALQATSFALDRVYYLLLSRMLFNYLKTIGIMYSWYWQSPRLSLSRRLKLPLSAEGYCATAMGSFNKLRIEGSIEGLQCLLLLQVYEMNNPSMGLNLRYLNYQCLACVVDLELQRNVKARRNLSFLNQEMRTRILWVLYSLDRSLATIVGRPIGLRDEACELRLPVDIDDDGLLIPSPSSRPEHSPPTFLTNAIQLFKLSQLISEIKYITNSISHKSPVNTYPRIPDILKWQDDDS